MMKKIAVAMIAAGGLVAVAPAHAGGHVSLSLGVGLPAVGYGYAAPTYYGPPAVVYAAPQPVYAPAPYYGGYAPAYYGPRAYGPGYYGPHGGPRYYGPRVVYRPYYGGGYGHGGWHR